MYERERYQQRNFERESLRLKIIGKLSSVGWLMNFFALTLRRSVRLRVSS